MKGDLKKHKSAKEEITEQVEKILNERGNKVLEAARNEILQEEIECKEAREALTYFITQCWHNVFEPTLLSLACEAVGGDPNITTPIAVSMILISGAIDIHDDIIDQSKIKRQSPTVLGKFGQNIALLAGDALLFKGFKLLYESAEKGIPVEKIERIIAIIKKSFFELGEAEALELRFRGRIDVTPEEYLYVVKKKSADVEAITHISAILGGGSKEEVEALKKYGRLLGMLIILRDDLLDMIDFDEAVHRIKKEHLPLPIIYVLQNPEIKSMLGSILQKKVIRKKDAKAILLTTEKTGGIDHFKKMMQELAKSAFNETAMLRCSRYYLRLLIKSVLTLLDEWREFTNV